MSTAEKRRYTPEEYLAFKRASETRHEYLNGEIFAMVGGSRDHYQIVSNLLSYLRPRLREKGCEVFQSDMRVKVSPSGLYTYPDVVIVCGEPERENDTLLNPNVLIEVLSPSTENYDRGAKAEQYRTLSSLKAHVLVSQDRYHVEVFSRQPENTWLLNEISREEDSLHLPTLDFSIPMSEVYHGVEITASGPNFPSLRNHPPAP